MADFIIRFEAGMDKLKAVNMIFSPTVEVAILQRAANLTKTEENNLLPMVRITSTDPNLIMDMKEALRNIGFRKDPTKKKEDVVLLQYNDEDKGQDNTKDEVLYGQGFQRGQGQG